MQTFRTPLQVLAFDRPPASIRSIVLTGCQIHQIISIDKESASALGDFWPPSEGVLKIAEQEALLGIRAGDYDVLLCWTLEDVQAAISWKLPKIFAPQCMLSTLVGVSGMARLNAVGQMQPLLEGISIVYSSQNQRENWLLAGEIVPLGIDVNEFLPYTGQCSEVLCVGQSDSECALLEGHDAQANLAGEGVDIRRLVVGGEGAETWAELKAQWAQSRVFLSALTEGHTDGYDYFVLAAMAAGMPIVSTGHSATPVVDGVNGFAANDYRYLIEKLGALLGNRDLAARLGANARRTVQEHFSLEVSVERWGAVLAQSVRGKVDEERFATAIQVEAESVVPRVSIIMPLFNKAEYTEKCLYAIAENTGDVPAYDVVLIDNASSDWTQYLLLAFEGDVAVLRNEENAGFARANNQGAAQAQGEYLLFLNNDTQPHPGWLRAMVELADSDAEIGIVGAKLLYPDTGAIQHAGIELINGVPDHVWRGVSADDPRVCQMRDLDMVTGACLLIRRALFVELGGFDMTYLNGVEDVDLCLQVRERGYRVVYCPDAVVDHHEGTSEGRFEHVRENLDYFVGKWQGHFDADGRFVAELGGEGVPVARDLAEDLTNTPAKATGSEIPLVVSVENVGAGTSARSDYAQILSGYWEGPFFVHSSLAQVNREMTLALLRETNCDLGLIASEPDQFDGLGNLCYTPLAVRMGQPPQGAVDFHLRHRWPPDVSRPSEGKLVLIQPWEYGSILKSWVEPMRANVDQIWAYTSYVRQVYIGSGFDADMVKVVPLGVDVDRFNPQVPAMELPTQKSFKFLFVGGTLQRKGIDLLLEAYRTTFSRVDDVCLVIKDMGTQTFYQGQTAGEQIAELQRDPQCGEIIYLTEDLPAEDLPGLYTACDCLVHPYRGEGFGLPVAEAMASGLAIVVTQGGACDDFCSEEHAFMVPAVRVPVRFSEETVGQAWMLEADVGALSESMRLACANPQDARAMGARGAEHIAENFTWAHAAEIAHSTLEKLCRPDEAAPAEEDVATGAPKISVAMPQGALSIAVPAGAEDDDEELAKYSSVVVALGGDGAETLDAISAALDGQIVGYDVTLSPAVGIGDQLEVIRQNASGELFVVFRRGASIGQEGMRQLVAHLEREPDLAVVEPCRPEMGRGVGVEEVDSIAGDLLVFRRSALDAIGGFSTAFSTAAVLDEVVRQLRRQGGRAVKVLGCVLVTVADPGPDAEAEAEALERASIEALDEGDWLRGEGRRAEALNAYRRAVEAKGDFVEAIIVLASMLMEEGVADEAGTVLEKLVALDTSSFHAHNYLGMARHQAGDRSAARISFLRALELNADHVETLINMSVLEWEEGEGDAAVDFLERAAALEPANRDVIVNAAIMQVQMGNVENGVLLLTDYVTKNGHDLEATRMLAEVLLQAGDVDNARQLATYVLAQWPDDAGARDILEKLGE